MKDTEESSMQIFRWEKSGWKGYILCDSRAVAFWKRQNYGDINKDWWLPGVRREEPMSGEGPGGFEGSEHTLCDAIMMDTCHRTFVKTQQNVLQEWMNCSWTTDFGWSWCDSVGLSVLTNIILLGDVDTGDGCAWVGAEKFLYFQLRLWT